MFLIPILLHFILAQSFSYLDPTTTIPQFSFSETDKLQTIHVLENIFKIYVHKQSKINRYGPSVDPLAKLSSLAQKSKSLTSQEFVEEISDIFTSLYDLHTRFYIPGPHQCLKAYQGLSFTVLQENDYLDVVVSDIMQNPEGRLYSPLLLNVTIGDKVVLVNDRSVWDHINSLKPKSGGAGVSGGLRMALRLMEVVDGRFYTLPKATTVKYKFQKIGGGEYEISLPWLLFTNNACYQRTLAKIQSQTISANKTGDATVNDVPTPHPINPKKKYYKRHFPPIDKPQKRSLPSTDFQPTSDPSIHWKILSQSTKNLGIIKITSFLPPSTYDSILIIRNLLTTKLNATNCLVFDVRGNTGGDLAFADALPQFFVPEFESVNARALHNDILLEILNSTSSGEYFTNSEIEVLQSVGFNTMEYTPSMKLTNQKQNQKYGMVYHKPVGILIDGTCYSACDVFVANMQDSDIAVVYGEDVSTGGGGGNVMDLSDFLSHLHPTRFTLPKFLLDTPVGSGGTNIYFAWRELIRVGKNNGKRIEDDGIKADVLIRPTLVDLTNNSITQYDKIASDLNLRYNITKPLVEVDFQLVKPVEFGGEITLPINSTGIHKFILQENETIVYIDTSVKNNSTIRLHKSTLHYKMVKLTLFGYDLKDRLVYQTTRFYRITPTQTHYLHFPPLKQYTLDFTNPPMFAQTYTQDQNTGWQWGSKHLCIGNNTLYENNLDTEVVFYINSTTPISIKIKANYETVHGYDVFYVGIERNGMKTQFLKEEGRDGVSGVGTVDEEWRIEGGEVGLFLEFRSDEVVGSRGVEITYLSITAEDG